MASLLELLQYKKDIKILNPSTGKPIKTVWVRVLGDLDLQKAYKLSRIASSTKRESLRNPESDDYKDEVLGLVDMTIDDHKDIIRTAKMSSIVAEAGTSVQRENLPKIEEIAVDADAASLEDLEKLDSLESEQSKKYDENIDEYIKNRTIALDAELDAMSSEKLLELAQYEVSNIIPLSVFLTELNAYKAFFGTYQDKDCQIPEFNSVDDFKQLPSEVRDQIIGEINNLEISGSDIKN